METNYLLCCLFVIGNLQIVYAKSSKHKHPIPTYFHRRNPDGSLISRADPSYGDIFMTNFINSVSSLDQATGSISVDPHNDVENGANVAVTWKNIVKPEAKDWIGLYCPHNDSAAHPLDYFFVTNSETATWHQGYGSKNVRVFNMRNECEFRYYRYVDGGVYTALAARSQLLTFLGRSSQPMHGHLSITNDPSQMRVMWISGTGEKAD